MKPDYLVIGAGKAATTTLCSLLGRHSNVLMSEPKELHFFSFPEQWSRGFDWYEEHFDSDDEAKTIRGEGSQSYAVGTAYPGVPERIHAYRPDVKLIYIAREPARRLESAWMEVRGWHSEKLAHRAWLIMRQNHTEIVDPDFSTTILREGHPIVESTNYWAEIQRYRKFFPDEQIRVLFFEDLVEDHHPVLRQCFEFLGVDPSEADRIELGHRNASQTKDMPGRLLTFLRSAPGVQAVYNAVRTALPRSVRSTVSSRFLRVPMERPVWTPEARETVLPRMRADLETFLEWAGRPKTFWTLEP